MLLTMRVVLDVNAPALVAVLRDAIAAVADIHRKVDHMSDNVNALDASITTLIADNAALKAAVEAAPAEIAALVAAGIASASSQGATPAQLQMLADLHTSLGGEVSQLQAALAGTAPAAPAAPVEQPGTPTV